MLQDQTLKNRISYAIQQRSGLVKISNAYRLFNGFYEGFPGIVLDRYGQTLVVFDHRGERPENQYEIENIAESLHNQLDWAETALLKQRNHTNQQLKNGKLLWGKSLASSIREFNIQYALDLQMNQDASFYLDTRNLRRWLMENTSGLSVLNTFAYTGSLGVTAGVGSAVEVVQTDLNRNFLEISQRSWKLNGLDDKNLKIVIGDYFRVAGRFRQQNRLFGCVIIDPPYFSQTSSGRIDLQNETTRLVNKIRPLVAHEGWLVLINNALYLSGSDFMTELDRLCKSEYMTFEQIIPIPQDITGYPTSVVGKPPVDPLPFNHPTKIAVLKVTRKDQRKSS